MNRKYLFLILTFSLLIISSGGSPPTGDVEDERLEKCSSNMYNCDNFKTHREAQKIYELCGGVSNDIHHLDKDLDGLACETLP